ncbi:hypothetical protein BC828DRAFT_395082 [Blastocladiella britannica]|nr:hypothetical protein BC828DRAFT_395082 [Blastocladiella britannica]
MTDHMNQQQLAVAYNDGRVVLFSPVIPTGPADSDELCWTVAADLRRVDPPTALAWMRDSLVIAGRSIEALAPTTTASGAMAWTSGWSAKAGAMPPTTVLASPDGKAIAAYRNGDRIVKVWMANDGRPLSHQLVRPYSFHYLSHPAPVTSIAWRGRRDSLTLMANCSDATCRIWTFALKLKTFSLILSLSMPPLPAAAVAAAAAMHSHRGADPNLASFSWLGLARIAPRPKPPSFLSGEQPGSSGTDKRTDPELAELVTMYDELVIGAAADGSVRVWGISNLDRRQGPPAAHLLKHHPNCLRASHFKSFHSLQIIQHAFSPTPEHLLILGKAQSGILSVYSVLVGHLIYHPNTKIRLVHEWAGHTRAAVPASDLVGAGPRDDPRRQPARASAQGKWLVTSTGGETMVWNPGERNMGMRQLKGLWMRRHRTATSAADATEWVVPTDTTDAGDVVVRRDRVQCGTAQAPLEGAPLDATVHTSSDGTRVASIVTTGGVHRYTVPSLLGAGEAGVPLPRLPTTLGTLVSRGMDACPYLAVTVHESTVRVHGLDGAVLVQHERVMVPVDGGDTKKQLIGAANVLQVAAANHTLVLRTPTALHIFSLGWVDHALVHEQTILDRCTATAVLGLPTGAVLLAAARDHLVHVHVRQVVSATESGWDLTSRWVVAATATMPGFVDAVAWTHQADLVAISGSAVVAVDAVPTLAELALRAAVPAPDSPAILREWLRWNRPDVVRAVFNQKYYALKGTDGGGGDMGMPAMTWPAIEKAAGLAPHNEGSSGGTSAADALAAELENLFASGGMDSDDSPAMCALSYLFLYT